MACIAGIHGNPLCAAKNRYSYEDNGTALREMRDSIADVRHEVNNHEEEIRIVEEKIKNQETALDALHDQISSSMQTSRDLIKDTSSNLEERLNSLETSVKAITSDLKQFKTFANDLSSALNQNKQKISDLQKNADLQAQNSANLQHALQSLLEAFGKDDLLVDTKSNVEPVSNTTYKVKSGDSLEKIARAHQTTVKIIKELNKNQIRNDKIIIGQTLKLPENK